MPEASLALTPAGTLHAFAQAEPNDTQTALQSVLAGANLFSVQDWRCQRPEHDVLLPLGLSAGWLQTVPQGRRAPAVKLEDFLPHVIGTLAGERRAALATMGGFCVASVGYTLKQAEALCAAGADFSEFARRQRARGWHGASHMVSFHEDLAMLMPSTSFVPFWVDGVDFCLVLAGEPLLNNPVLVELLWALKASGRRFGGAGAAG